MSCRELESTKEEYSRRSFAIEGTHAIRPTISEALTRTVYKISVNELKLLQ